MPEEFSITCTEGSILISKKAKIGINVTLGSYVKIYDNVVIGDNSIVEDFCVLGHPAGQGKHLPLNISEDSIIRSHSILYEGSSYGQGLRVGHSSLLREGVVAGRNFQVGSFNDLEGDVVIGDWVRFHSNVHIGRGSIVGDLVWIFPYVVLTNDPIPPSGLKEGVVLGDGSVVCTSSVVLPGTVVGRGAFIAAMTRARGSIPAASLIVGPNGDLIGSIRKLKHKNSGKQHPWMTHFADYYPPEAQPRISELLKKINGDILLLDASLQDKQKHD